MKRILVFVALSCLLFCDRYSYLEAQWPVDPAENMQILTNAISPVMVSDGLGGAIVIAPVLVSCPYIVAQRVDRDGYILWDKDLYGIEVAQKEELDITGAAQLLPDGHGGVFVAYNYCSFIGWIEEPPGPEFDYDVYVQHIDSSGTVLWGDRGVPVCTLAGNQIVEGIVTDAEGGMIVIWTNGGTHAQRLNGEGEILWEENGKFLSDMFYNLGVSDGVGGLIMFLISSSTGEKINPVSNFAEWDWSLLNRRFQRMDKNGEVVWSSDIDWDFSVHEMIVDYLEGVIAIGIFLCGIEPCGVKAQRMNQFGEIMWEDEGMVLVENIDNVFVHSTSDCEGGIITSISKGFLQRIDVEGNILWGEGVPIHGENIISDGVGGAIIVFANGETSYADFYSQRVDSTGSILWEEGGVLFSLQERYSNFQLVPDLSSGVLISWYVVGTERGIFLKKVNKFGILGGAKGDINLDGVINILDVIGVVNIILGNSKPPTEYEMWAADFNEDNQVDIVDVIGIVDRILGLDPR